VVRVKLKDWDREIRTKTEQEKPGVEYRVSANVQHALTRKFLNQMHDYLELQTQLKRKSCEQLAVFYRIAYPHASDQEIATAIESGEISRPFEVTLLDKKQLRVVKDAVSCIEAKRRDVCRIEQATEELLEIFRDMMILVEAQEDLIDNIEFNVSPNVCTGVEHVELFGNKFRTKLYCMIT